MKKFNEILLIEDDPITIMVCDRIIKMCLFSDNVESCENGKRAIDYLAGLAEIGKNFPELIFLDINMPVMNGWDFLEEYEKLDTQLKKSTRIFILSSTVDPEDYQKARDFGNVEDFISKPLNRELLERIN